MIELLIEREVARHQAELRARAHREELARPARRPREPLLRVRITIELQLGRSKLSSAPERAG